MAKRLCEWALVPRPELEKRARLCLEQKRPTSSEHTFLLPPELWRLIYDLLAALLEAEWSRGLLDSERRCQAADALWCSQGHRCPCLLASTHATVEAMRAQFEDAVHPSYQPIRQYESQHCIFCRPSWRAEHYAAKDGQRRVMPLRVKRHLDRYRKLYLVRYVLGQ